MADLPRIDVEILPEDKSRETIPNTTPTNHASNMLATPTAFGRDRSLSGSTAYSSLKPPSTSHGDKTSIFSEIDREDALKPDPGSEEDFELRSDKFAFSPGQLNKLLGPKSLPAYVALGGIHGIAHGLRTNLDTGLSTDETNLDGKVSFNEAVSCGGKSRHLGWDEVLPNPTSRPVPETVNSQPGAFIDRLEAFSSNSLPEKKATSLWKLVWMAYKDKVLILLTVAAAISLALGLYETFGVDHPPDAPMPVEWIEGCAICIAILVVVLFGSLTDYQKERAFVKLNAKKDDREVKVIRSGKSVTINIKNVLAGDILHLEPGDMVPVDGIFIGGHNVKCDESSATGESDALKKVGGEQVMRMIDDGHTDLKHLDCFIISGSKVLEGVGTYMATSVGVNSSYGKILMAMRVDMDPTPLQVKLDGLATAIAKLGSSAAIFLFFVLLFRFLADLGGNPASSAQKASEFLDILIVAVTVIVVAVPEGLPLAVTLALAFATTRMVKANNLVRILKSCETMGNATTVCSDKTGTLTTNIMTVVTGYFGGRTFDDKNKHGNEITSSAFAGQLSVQERRRLIDAIALNSTAFEGADGEFVGSKTETALLSFAKALGMGPVAEERSNAQLVQLMPFDSARKCMGAVQKLANGTYLLHVKGASEILLNHSSKAVQETGVKDLGCSEREALEDIIDSYAKQSLRTIALVSREFQQWPPQGCADEYDPNAADFGLVLKDMTFDGLVGIQDPVRPGVQEAVSKCQHAGVTVRMVTGDNLTTAKAIATECGIYTGGVVMEGPVFRTLNQQEMNEVLPKLQVLARSSPEDKRILVSALRKLDEIVAVTGDGTNDGPALKAADIGFSMGISGTEVAKEASAIILMDDNFASILTALMWGRSVNDAVRKFLQFQITVNITAVIVTFVSAVADPDMDPVLIAIQLLWINLIMDSMAALALASDAPTEEILNRKPARRSAPLISTTMWKMIIGQTIYQLTATFVLYYAGPSILNYPFEGDKIRSIVFNAFVWMQVFNMFNNRRLDNKFNVLEGVHRNYFYLLICAIMVGCQVMIMFVGGKAFEIVRIDGKDWAISIVLGLLCLPWAVLVRLFPDWLFEKIARFLGKPALFIYRPLRRWTRAFSTRIRTIRRKRAESEIIAEQSAEMESSGRVQDIEMGR